MNKVLIILSLIFAMILTACGGEAVESAAAGESSSGGSVVQVNEDYKDALPVQSQLAIGTLQLESGDNAVDEALAAELLPLWRAVQSLASSETTADAEVTAVLNQIQDTMTVEQVTAITAMQITQERFDEMMANGEISMGRGAFGGGQRDSEGGGFAGGPGGGPGGELPGGGGGPGGGAGGLGGDPSAIETRMAERGIEGGVEELQANAMTNAVIRLLETKTGEVSEPALGSGLMGEAITAVAEATGLAAEDIQAAMGEGKTLASIVEENGGDLEAIKAKLVEAFADSEFLQDQDPDEFITNFLAGSSFGAPPGNE